MAVRYIDSKVMVRRCNGSSKVLDKLNEDRHTHMRQMICPKKEMLIHPLMYKNGSPHGICSFNPYGGDHANKGR